MIHSVAILNKTGKLLIARQFTHENRDQIEGHLSAFPKLVQSAGHTYIDTESIRFVFQELSNMYIVIVASKDSNIVTDLETLNLFVDVTRNTVGELSEENIISHGLDLIFAYDECVFDGFKQNYTIHDINKFLQMESAEEAEFERQRQMKEMRAAQELKQKLAEFDKAKQGDKSGLPGIISQFTHQAQTFQNPIPQVQIEVAPQSNAPSYQTRPTKQGMSLSKARNTRNSSKAKQVMEAEGLHVEPEVVVDETPVIQPGLNLLLQERYNADLSESGLIHELSVEGRLIAVASKRMSSIIQISGDLKTPLFKYKVMDKDSGANKMWNQEKQLQYDNTSGKYTPNSEITLLCWRAVSKDENFLPISISCWIPQRTKATCTVDIEVELKNENMTFDEVVLSIPLETPHSIKISQCDGDYEVFERDGYLKWTLVPLDSNNTRCELEFTVGACDESSFYPISVSFSSPCTLCEIDVSNVIPSGGDEAPEFHVKKICNANKFRIA